MVTILSRGLHLLDPAPVSLGLALSECLPDFQVLTLGLEDKGSGACDCGCW